MHIRPRSSWGARTPKPRTRQRPRDVRELFIHWPGLEKGSTSHIRTEAQEHAELRNEQAFHMDTRGWSDIGYNYAVFQSGRVYRLRGLAYVPAAQLGHNTNTVSVTCILGPDDKPSANLVAALVALKNNLDRRTGRDLPVRPHHAVTGTTCPGPALTAIIPTLNKAA